MYTAQPILHKKNKKSLSKINTKYKKLENTAGEIIREEYHQQKNVQKRDSLSFLFYIIVDEFLSYYMNSLGEFFHFLLFTILVYNSDYNWGKYNGRLKNEKPTKS